MPVSIFDKLSDEEYALIYRLAGEGYAKREIMRKYNQLFRKDNNKKAGNTAGHPYITTPTIERVLEQPEAQRHISKYRLEFLKNVKDIPVADKKVRLDDLENMRMRLRGILNSCHLERGDKNFNKFLTVTRRLIEILDMARNEMEPRNGINIGIGLGQGEMGELTDEQLQAERDELIRKANLVIKRGNSAVDEFTEGDEKQDSEEPPEILLASPTKLRRKKLQKRDPKLSDIRQQKDNDKGLPSV